MQDSKSMFIATEWEVHLWIRDAPYAKYIAVSRIKEDRCVYNSSDFIRKRWHVDSQKCSLTTFNNSDNM